MDEHGDTGRSSKPRSLRTRRSACASSSIARSPGVTAFGVLAGQDLPIRRMTAENIDCIERQLEEERNEEDLIKTTKPRSRVAGISRKPTASPTVLAQTVASRTTPRSGPPPTRATLRFATSRVSQRSPWAPSPMHRDR